MLIYSFSTSERYSSPTPLTVSHGRFASLKHGPSTFSGTSAPTVNRRALLSSFSADIYGFNTLSPTFFSVVCLVGSYLMLLFHYSKGLSRSPVTVTLLVPRYLTVSSQLVLSNLFFHPYSKLFFQFTYELPNLSWMNLSSLLLSMLLCPRRRLRLADSQREFAP